MQLRKCPSASQQRCRWAHQGFSKQRKIERPDPSDRKKVADSTVHDNEKHVQGCQLGSQCNTGGAGRKVQLTPLQSSLIPFQQSQAQVVVQVSGYYGVAQRGSYAPT